MYTANRLEWHQGDETHERTPQITVADLVKASSEAFACVSIAFLLLSPRAKIHQSYLRGFSFGEAKGDHRPKFAVNLSGTQNPAYA